MSLEKFSHIAVITAAFTVIGFNIFDRVVTQTPQAQTRPISQMVGNTLPLPLPKSAPIGRLASAVIFVSNKCRYCTESMGFYRSLAQIKRAHQGEFALFGVVPAGRETREEGERYFAGNSILVDNVAVLKFEQAGVAGTPTLIVVDGARRVVGVWVGKLSGEREAEVRRTISGLCTQCISGS